MKMMLRVQHTHHFYSYFIFRAILMFVIPLNLIMARCSGGRFMRVSNAAVGVVLIVPASLHPILNLLTAILAYQTKDPYVIMGLTTILYSQYFVSGFILARINATSVFPYLFALKFQSPSSLVLLLNAAMGDLNELIFSLSTLAHLVMIFRACCMLSLNTLLCLHINNINLPLNSYYKLIYGLGDALMRSNTEIRICSYAQSFAKLSFIHSLCSYSL